MSVYIIETIASTIPVVISAKSRVVRLRVKAVPYQPIVWYFDLQISTPCNPQCARVGVHTLVHHSRTITQHSQSRTNITMPSSIQIETPPTIKRTNMTTSHGLCHFHHRSSNAYSRSVTSAWSFFWRGSCIRLIYNTNRQRMSMRNGLLGGQSRAHVTGELRIRSDLGSACLRFFACNAQCRRVCAPGGSTPTPPFALRETNMLVLQ